jgi:hypothetical protein
MKNMNIALVRRWQKLGLLLLALFTIGVGCDKFKGMTGQKSGSSSEVGKGASDKSESKGASFFDDASSIPTKFAEKRGGAAKFLELVIYPEYANAQLQDPAKRENVDAYELRNGKVSEEGPVKFTGEAPTAKDLDEACIDAKTVDFAVVPKIVKDAVVQTKIEDGKVTHIMFSRPRPFSNDPRWRVYVNGARKNGSVEYDIKGTMVKVY